MSEKSNRSRLGTDNGGTKTSPSVITRDETIDYDLPIFIYGDTSPNTSIAAPSKFSVTVPLGIIEYIWVELPPGCNGLVGLCVKRGVYQVFPLPESVWFVSNGNVFKFKTSVKIETHPFTLDLYVYNLDDTYNHKPWVAFELSAIDAPMSENLKQFIKAIR